MNEETTTSTPVDDAAAPDAGQAEATTNEQAVQDVNETSEATSSDESVDTNESVEDSEDDIKTWAEKKGLKLDDPIALAKMVREGDKKVTEATQKASELGKSVETASGELGLDDVAELKNKVAVMEFYQAHPDARDLDAEMAEILSDKPYFANDLDALYLYTKGKLADKKALAERQAGRKEALAEAAQAERAGAPKVAAKGRETSTTYTDEDVGNMTPAEYDAAVAAGKIQPFRP